MEKKSFVHSNVHQWTVCVHFYFTPSTSKNNYFEYQHMLKREPKENNLIRTLNCVYCLLYKSEIFYNNYPLYLKCTFVLSEQFDLKPILIICLLKLFKLVKSIRFGNSAFFELRYQNSM